MRICLYTDSALPKMGAQELAVDALARAYGALGHQPVVLAPWPKQGTVAVDQTPYPVLRHPRFFSAHYLTPWYRWFLQNHYERYPFDILHCHGVYPPSYLAALSRSIIPTPIVVTSHGNDISEKNARLMNPLRMERIAEGLQAADAIVAINPYTHERLARLCPEAATRIVDIPLGVDLADFTDQAPRPPELATDIEAGAYALFVGRLKNRSGVDTLLQAIARTPADGRVQLVLLGDGEDRALLEILAEQLDLLARIRFVNNASDAVKRYLLQNARFGVVAARHCDASATVILDAYAAKVPMVATDLPAWSYLIQPEKTGLLVSSDAPDELAEAMTRLFADDVLVRQMSARASAYGKVFDWPMIAERHLSLYRNLLLQGDIARAA